MTNVPTRPRRGDRRRLLGVLALAAGWPTALRVAEDDAARWPPPRIRLIVAHAVGGLSSEVAPALGDTLARQLAVTVLVEHRPGAGGTPALGALARSPADGSVIAFSAITPLTLARLLGRVPYDAERDIVPVTGVMRTPVLVVGTSALPAGAELSVQVAPEGQVVGLGHGRRQLAETRCWWATASSQSDATVRFRAT